MKQLFQKVFVLKLSHATMVNRNNQANIIDKIVTNHDTGILIPEGKDNKQYRVIFGALMIYVT